MKTTAKKYIAPTKIQLNEIPDEGRQFQYDREGGELNQILEDLIGDQTYDISVNLLPSGNVYSISGDLKTRLETQCSRCGRDMDLDIDGHFNELIVVEDPRPRKSDSGHSMPEDSSIFCNHVSSENFNLGEFIHEQVAANQPNLAKCGRTDCESFLEQAQARSQAPDGMGSKNPFEALKNFKPNH